MSRGIKISIRGIEYKFPNVCLTSTDGKYSLLSPSEERDILKSAAVLPEFSLAQAAPGDILDRIRAAKLPFSERLSGFMESGCEKVIVNCMNGFSVCDTEKIIGGAKILLLTLKVRKGEFALDVSDKTSTDALSKEIKGSEMFSCVKLPSLFPISNNRVLSFCMYPYLKRKTVAVFSCHELVSLYDAIIDGRIYEGSRLRLVYDCKYFDTFIPKNCKVSDILNFASECFGSELSWVRIGVSGLGTKLPPDSMIPSDICALSFGRDPAEKKECKCSGCTVCREVCPFSISPDLLMLVGSSDSPDLKKCALCGLCDEFCPSGIRISEKITAKSSLKATKKTPEKFTGKAAEKDLGQLEVEDICDE